METGINDHIKEYLDYYIELEGAPEFAVLLRGKWGSGKSWFIRNYIKEKGAERFLYVSLYGITSYADIEDAFFMQLHPLLASKGMKIAGKILKGVLKTTLKIELDSDKSRELNVSGNIPDLDIPEYFKRADGKVIIFDDLERCSVPIHQMLGYINQYVETNGLKVIIIANEDEIIKTDEHENKQENATRYLTIKEKLIGKSFDVELETYAAVQDFIESLGHSDCKKYLQSFSVMLILLFRDAGYNNLRHLKQALLDFERFYEWLDEDILACKPLMSHVAQLFFIISMEVKSGTIHEDEIADLFSLTSIIKKDTDAKSAISKVREKYRIFPNNAFHPLSPELWMELFRTGRLDRDSLNEELHSSYYMTKNEEENWRKLMYFEGLEDSQFQPLHQSVYDDLATKGIDNPYIVVQVTGILIFLVKAGIVELAIDTITQMGIDNLVALKDNHQLNYHELRDFPGHHSHGLGYAGKNIPEFEKFLSDAKRIVDQSELESLPKRAAKLMELLKSDPKRFIEKLDYTKPENVGFTLAPVLSYIDVNDFSSTLLQLSNSNKSAVIDTLESRYSYGYNTPLDNEKYWLRDLAAIVEIEANKHSGSVSSYLLKNRVKTSLQRSMGRFNYNLE